MKYQYSVTIVRHEIEDGDNVVDITEIVDQWITADDAIELMMHIRENISDASETEQEEDEEIQDEIEEVTVAPVKVKKPNTPKRTGMKVDYDVEALKDDIRSGMKAAKIAEKHGVSTVTVYQRKSDMKKAGELDDAPKVELPKSFGQMKSVDDDDIDEDLERDVADAIRDGEDLQSLTTSFPSTPLPTLKKLFDKYQTH